MKIFHLFTAINTVILFICTSDIMAQTDVQTAYGNKKDAWFADGYHGGIYGHYPVEWYTRFIVEKLKANPEWRIGLEIEPETWDTVRARTPEAYFEFRQMAAGRQIEFTNPTYAQPYLYNISGESIIRQFYHGIRKLRSHFPDIRLSAYCVEEPCFTSCLPQLLKLFGLKYASLKCPDTCWGGYMAPYGGELVNWTGPDGTSVLTVPRYACEDLKEGSTWQTIAWDNSPFYIDKCLEAGISHPLGMCYQDAGWKNGPWLSHESTAARRSVYTLLTDYIENVTPGSTTHNYRMSQNDVRVALMWGSQVLQRIARSVRKTENLLVQTEKIAAMAGMECGYTTPRHDLDEAWRTLMLAQHHDSWIVPYNNLNDNGTWADNIRLWTTTGDSIATAIKEKAFESFDETVQNSKQEIIRVYNTLGHRRRGIVSATLSSGRNITFEADVPACGYRSYTTGNLHDCRQENSITVGTTDCIMENDTYRIVFDLTAGGAIRSITDKEHGDEYVAANDSMPFNSLRGFFPAAGGFRSSIESRATATVLADNSLIKSIRIDGQVAGTDFSQTITIGHRQKNIDCTLCVHWNKNMQIGDHRFRNKQDKSVSYYDTRYMLSLFFPTMASKPLLSKSAPFDVCENNHDSTFFNRWDSIRHNIINGWIDLAGEDGKGLALFSDHTTSYTYGPDRPLSLTVQYSGGGLWWRDYPVNGPTHIRYAIVPHHGTWDESGIGSLYDGWNEPLITHSHNNTGNKSCSFVDTGNSGYTLSALIPDKDSFIMRLYNQSGNDTPQRIIFGIPVKKIEETDLNGHVLHSCHISRNSITVTMPRFGIRTFKISL